MKKLILGLAVTAGTLAFAQQTPSSVGAATFGIKGGMNVSSLSNGADLSDSKSKIGFNAGVFANIPLASSFSVQPEVIYNDLGSKVTREYSIVGNKYKDEYSRNLGYIAVPVMFQYNATPEFYLEAGPAGYYFTQNLGITARYTAGLTDIYKNNSGDAVKNNVFQVGLAYKFK